MEVTQVRVFPVDEDKLKAFVSVIFDDCFVVSDIKIIEGANGLFISMPSKKRRNGTFRDIAHPLNSETRQRLEQRIIEKYCEVVGKDARSVIRRLGGDLGLGPPQAGVPEGPANGA
jgi:stage V sporulation protein G